MQLANTILAALKSRYEADRLEAVVRLNLYLNTPVGIGDHSNIVEEASSAIKAIATAEENLRVLYASLESNKPPNENEQTDDS